MAANVTLTLMGPLWSGLASEKAAVKPANGEHALYYETDTGAAGLTNPWFIWQDSAWVAFVGFPFAAGSGGGGGPATPATGVPGSIVRIRSTLNSVSPGVIAAAGDYTAGDVLNNSTSAGLAWIAPSIARLAAAGILVQKVLITCSVAALVPRLRLHMFNAVPGTLQNDNVAFVLAAADRDKYIGYIDMPAMSTSGSSELSWSEADIQWIGKTAADANLYFVLQTLDSFTNESAGMTIDVYFTGVQN